MLRKPTTATTGFSFPAICFARMIRSAISCAVRTISTTGVSVYCLMMDACRPRAMMMVAPSAMDRRASITVSPVWITRISWISNFFSCKMLWAWWIISSLDTRSAIFPTRFPLFQNMPPRRVRRAAYFYCCSLIFFDTVISWLSMCSRMAFFASATCLERIAFRM